MSKAMGIALRKCVAVCALAVSALAVMPSANAENVDLAAGWSMANGPQSWTSGIAVTGAGRLTVQVNDLGVPNSIADRLQTLSFSISNSTSVLGAYLGAGSLSLDVKEPGLLFLNISAIPSINSLYPNLQFGVVSWNATLEPPAPVPLPASLWLLVAGAAWATGLQRKRAKVGSDESSGFLPWRARPALAH